MNLKKLTKAELISKLKTQKSDLNNPNQTLFTNLMNILLYFKALILKITLLAIIIKIFKKYSIFRRIWTIFNTIIVTIFGFSLIDIFEIDLLAKLFHSIFDNFSKFNTNLLELFGKKVDIPSRSTGLNSTQQNANGSSENNRIIERFTKIIHKDEEVIEENTPLYKNKYVIIAGILILSGLTWYFYDDLKPIGSSVLAWINACRSRPNPDSDGSNGSLQGSSKQDIPSLKDRLMKRFYNKEDENPSSPKDSSNQLIGSSGDKGKAIDFNNLTQSEIQERGLLQQPTVMREITGNDFKGESASVLREIDSFLVQQEAKNFPNSAIQTQLYDLLRGRLFKLSQTDLNKYQELLQSDSVNNKIQKI
jgi:hypothetical protein